MAGDESVFNTIYNETYKYLHTCVIHIVKDEDIAQDMLQNTYMEMIKSISQLKEAENFLGWAATIANRKCIAEIKKQRDVLLSEQTDEEGNEQDYFESVADDEALIPENVFDDKAKVDIIRGIIDDLSDVQRACVIGFYYNEQKQDEIADELGLPVNTVKSHINRAKVKIKEAVGDIEKKQGVKLYSLSPFMLLLFAKEAETYAMEHTIPDMGVELSKMVTAGTTVAAGTVKGKAAVSSIKGVVATAKTKLAIGMVASVVTVAGATSAYVAYNSDRSVDTVVPENDSEVMLNVDDVKNDPIEVEKAENYLDFTLSADDIRNQIIINGKRLSETTYEEFLDLCNEAGKEPTIVGSNGLSSYPVTIYSEEINGFEGGQICLQNGIWLNYNKQKADDDLYYGFIVSYDMNYPDETVATRGYDYEYSDFLENGNMSMEDFLNIYDPRLYEFLQKYEEVYFNGGTIVKTTSEGTIGEVAHTYTEIQIYFDEPENKSYDVMSVTFFQDGRVGSFNFGQTKRIQN